MLERHLDKIHPDIAMEMKIRYGFDHQQVTPPGSDFGHSIFGDQGYVEAPPVVTSRGRGKGRGRGSGRGRG